MAAIRTRDFAPPDIAGILEIQRAAEEMAQWRAGDYERLVKEPGGLILVAEWAGIRDIAGFAAARAIGKEAELQNLAVRAGLRRHGVARQLVGSLHERLTQTGVERIFLEARVSNFAALNLYRSCGYTECGVRRNYYANDGEDALVLERRLTG